MCFSATASFAASGGLAVVGVASYQTANKKQKMLALIPILFAIQQAIEGFQWVSLGRGSSNLFLAYGFLFFAFLLWPIYIPWVVKQFDEKNTRVMRWFVGAGIGASLFLLGDLLFFPLDVVIYNQCIQYDVYVPFQRFWAVLYVSIVCGSMIVSSIRAFRLLGVFVFVSAAFSAYMYLGAFTSVWCFFAALLSVGIFYFIKEQNRKKKLL